MSQLDSVKTFVFKVLSYDVQSLKAPKVEIDLKNELDLDLDQKYRVVPCFKGLGECFAKV